METKRLCLRQFMQTDLNDFSELIRDKMSSLYACYDSVFPTDDQSLQEILNYFSSSKEYIAVVLKEEQKVIGFISLNQTEEKTVHNLGFCIHTKYQNRGYATEAVEKIMRNAREEGKLTKLISGTAKENEPTMRLLKKEGFTITESTIASFAKDENGNPITFEAYSFECIL